MKQVKRFVSLLMCAVLAAGCLTGCGGKSDETILSTAVKSVNEAKNFDMAAKMSGKMKLTMGDMSQDMDMDMDMKSTQFTDPLKAKVTSTVTSAGTSVTTECYVTKEDDKYVTYTKVAGQWSKMSLGNLDEAMAASGMDSIQKQLGEDASQYTKKDDIEENGKKYLTYDYTVTGDAIKDMMNGMSSSIGGILGAGEEKEQMEKIMNDMVASIGDITMTVLFDRETDAIYQIRYPMTDMMNKMMDSLLKSVGDIAKEEGATDEDMEDLSSMKFEASDLNMVITYSNIGSAADFEIPKEALEAEEMDLTGDAGSDDADAKDADSADEA